MKLDVQGEGCRVRHLLRESTRRPSGPHQPDVALRKHRVQCSYDTYGAHGILGALQGPLSIENIL
jgi:hypothetical protein